MRETVIPNPIFSCDRCLSCSITNHWKTLFCYKGPNIQFLPKMYPLKNSFFFFCRLHLNFWIEYLSWPVCGPRFILFEGWFYVDGWALLLCGRVSLSLFRSLPPALSLCISSWGDPTFHAQCLLWWWVVVMQLCWHGIQGEPTKQSLQKPLVCEILACHLSSWVSLIQGSANFFPSFLCFLPWWF